jgi:hypothetical protein
LRSLLPLFPLAVGMGQDTVGSKACSGCHAQIYRKYSAASMSRSSGKVSAGAFRENFDHEEIEQGKKLLSISLD